MTLEPGPRKCRVDLVVGTRPNIVKLSSLARVLHSQDWCAPRIIFIAQHTHPELTSEVFRDVGIAAELVRTIPLDREGYGARLGEVVSAYSDELASDRPDLVVVFGDVDVTLGAALAAKRCNITLAHIEAGLRSDDMAMPEEMNRILVDSITDLFYAPSEDAFNNLVYREGKDPKRVHFAGNIMIDTLVSSLDPQLQDDLETRYGIARGDFAIATFHRPSNVDGHLELLRVVELLEFLAERTRVLLPLHPRTERALARHSLRERLASNDRILDTPALGYRPFLNLLALAGLVITDSGGIQEEASFLGVPCLTFRDNTERPVTIRLGTNTLVNHCDAREVIESVLRDPRPGRREGVRIPLWDGRTALRIAASMRQWWLLGQ